MPYFSQFLLFFIGFASFLRSEVPFNSEAQRRSYLEEVAFLKKRTPLVELKRGDAALVIAPDFQARVMTSTTSREDGIGHGWMNHRLIDQGFLSPEKARGRLEEHIYVMGGEERFWLGPEGGQYGLFFPPSAPFDFAHWKTPPSLDTEPFQTLSTTATQAHFQRDISLQNRKGTVFDLRVDRTIQLLSPQEVAVKWKVSLPPDLKGVAYESLNRVTNRGKNAWEPAEGMISIWILGMYKPTPKSRVVIPLGPEVPHSWGNQVNRTYFGPIPDSRLRIDSTGLVFKADGKERGKIGVSPQRSLGICGSYSPDLDSLTLVAYNRPATLQKYVNSVWELQKEPYQGDAVNAYNDGSPAPGEPPLGPFYELETSSPAAELKPGESLEHRQLTIHLTGSPEKLDPVALRYLKKSTQQIVQTLP